MVFFCEIAFGQSLYHKVIPNQIVKKGELVISTEPLVETVRAVIQYKVNGPLIPRKYREGTLKQELDLKYETEDGYLELERIGSETRDGHRLVHQGRDGLKHLVGIYPSHGDWSARVTYDPEAPSLGWVALKVTLKAFSSWPIESVWIP